MIEFYEELYGERWLIVKESTRHVTTGKEWESDGNQGKMIGMLCMCACICVYA